MVKVAEMVAVETAVETGVAVKVAEATVGVMEASIAAAASALKVARRP